MAKGGPGGSENHPEKKNKNRFAKNVKLMRHDRIKTTLVEIRLVPNLGMNRSKT